MTHAIMGRWEEGIAACQESVRHAPDPLSRAIASGWLGYAYFEKDEGASAVPHLEQSISEFARFGFAQLQGWFTVFLAEARRQTGDLEQATTLALQGLAYSTEARSPYGLALAQRALGRISYAQGDLTAAETYLDQALQTFATMETRYDLGRVRLDLALLTHAKGDQAGATLHLHEANRLFVALQLPAHIARAQELARTLSLPFDQESSEESR